MNYDVICLVDKFRQNFDRKINRCFFINKSVSKKFDKIFWNFLIIDKIYSVVNDFDNCAFRQMSYLKIVVLLIVKWCLRNCFDSFSFFHDIDIFVFKKNYVLRFNICMLTSLNCFHFVNTIFFETYSWFTLLLKYCFLINIVSSKILFLTRDRFVFTRF